MRRAPFILVDFAGKDTSVKNKDLRLGVALMIIFMILFGISFTLQSSDVMKTHTTAAFFPRVVLIVAMFFTLLLIIQNIKKGADTSDKEKMDRESFKRVVLSMVSAVLFGFGVSYLGTLVSISLFVIAVMLTWGVRKKMTILLNAVITPILIYLIFAKILYVQLPSGILK